jgi:hypothetical protein
MIMLIYAAIAIAFLVLIMGLVRKPQPLDSDDAYSAANDLPRIASGRWLDLSERIFDPSDARWLQEELAFPKLAKSLIAGRKQLAIRWLEILQASFDDLVRTPEFAPSEASMATLARNWQMLWLTLRFKFLVSYALVVVKVFGPYHRLIPSFNWAPLSPDGEGSFWASGFGS